MDPELENRLKAAYPSGKIDGLAEAALVSGERDERITEVLKFIAANTHTVCTPGLFNRMAYDFTFAQKEHPEFNDWIWEMDNPAKLNWIKQAGEPYPVLWLKISRIANYFDYFFNLWSPRSDTGFLDPKCDYDPPNSTWTSHLNIVKAALVEYDFQHISDDLARTNVPFILEKDYDSIPDDDPRWDEDTFEPPHRPATVYRCTFGE